MKHEIGWCIALPGEATRMAITDKLMTADDLWRLPDDGQRHELVAGELEAVGEWLEG